MYEALLPVIVQVLPLFLEEDDDETVHEDSAQPLFPVAAESDVRVALESQDLRHRV